MKMKRLKTVFMAVLLLGAAITTPQPVAASHDCTVGDTTMWGVWGAIAQSVDGDDMGTCDLIHQETQDVNYTATDAAQTKIDIYQNGQNQKANSDILHTAYSNYLQDTQNIALIHGKNAYIRELNNGSSKSAAETAAKQAIEDYYATKQINLVEGWNNSVNNLQYLNDVVVNETGISNDQSTSANADAFIDVYEQNPDNISSYQDYYALFDGTEHPTTQAENLTLVNSTSKGVMAVNVGFDNDGGNDQAYTVNFLESDITMQSSSGIGPMQPNRIAILQPDTTYSNLTYLDLDRFHNRWDTIVSQESNAQSQMQTFINQTYSNYTSGEINNTELVDPYLMQQEFSPENSTQPWAVTSLSLLGVGRPSSLSGVTMNVTDETSGTQYTGILMTDNMPDNGTLSVNTTYDAGAIAGPQYVVTGSSIHELTGNFTVTSIESGGTEQQNATYTDTQYSTANTSELKALYEELSMLRAEIEAMENSMGGGGSSSGISATQAVAGGAALLGAAYLLGGGQNGGGRRGRG